ncbi:acyltransferase [Cellulosimicrobium terreum]|nr:acyltransferase [Cellulosimicrobium terreum]
MRAIAVGAVLLYHVWPGRLPGGYVGVDVFLVISGFLITAHLVRSPVTDVRGLLRFWARRVRRLVPAATVVLVATVVASAVWMPRTTLDSIAREVLASAFSVENWVLAGSATDYLAADELHTPVQHFWSLSVEEQFYLVWPALLGVCGLLVTRLGRSVRPGAGALAVTVVVVVVSFVWSLRVTATNPAAAYFVSTTRFWELALGGLIAVLVARGMVVSSPGVRAGLAWLGLAGIASSALVLDGATPFPGYAAALPTLATALVLLAASDGVRGGPDRLLSLGPVQRLGDVSYSLYLWHWPVVVIAPFALGRDLGLVDQVVLVAAVVVLAWSSKRLVEDPVRGSRHLRRLRRSFVLLGICTVVSAAAAGGLHVAASHAERVALAQAEAEARRAAECLGAGTARDPACAELTASIVPDPVFAAGDKPPVYADECWNNVPYASRTTCVYGPTDAERKIALVGNSHAGHWVPAFLPLLADERWQLTTFLQSVCYTVDLPLRFDDTEATQGCREINRWAVDSITDGGFDLVVMSDRTYAQIDGVPESGRDAAATAGYREVLETFTDAGLPVLVLRDPPTMPEDVPDCLAAAGGDAASCSWPREEVVVPDPLATAAEQDTSGLVTTVSVDDLLCDEAVCSTVVGGAIVYFDHGHLSATFSRTLAPEVADGARRALAAAQGRPPES